jgi:predicted DsbA family dithiol-disulfide isomerase
MNDQITFFFDYGCPFTYRARRWLDDVQSTGRAVAITWKTFSLREANRSEGTPSHFDTPGTDASLLRLELGKAAQTAGTDVFARVHEALYEAMHGTQATRPDFDATLRIAAEAGLDIEQFLAERQRWLDAVAHDHREAVERWRTFGVPTLVFDDRAARFLKFTSLPPSPEAAAALYDRLTTLVREDSGLVEIKQP